MEFRGIYIAHPAHLSVRRGQLIICQEQEFSVPMEDLTGLPIESTTVTITAAALQALSATGVTVYLCDKKHMPASIVLPINQHSQQLKLLEGQIALSRPTQKRLWQSIVSSKIANQAYYLSLLGKAGAEDLKYMSRTVCSGDPDNLEASAAALAFPALFGAGFTRGSDCLTNAALNCGYAIVRGAMARNLVMHDLGALPWHLSPQ